MRGEGEKEKKKEKKKLPDKATLDNLKGRERKREWKERKRVSERGRK